MSLSADRTAGGNGAGDGALGRVHGDEHGRRGLSRARGFNVSEREWEQSAIIRP